ncbi:MAG: tRNA (guanosine(46)-N7)-methyltransferase TrmB [Flavobacteriaceae bacterium]
MGSKNKLKRFKENLTFKNVIQPSREILVDNNFEYKGKWNDLFFKNNNPIIIELGCGKGEYSIELAKLNPEKNFIGIDIKGARFWRGAKTAIDEGLNNIAFVRSQIELIDKIFSKGEVSEIWITFPDPQIKFKREKHRLINLKFINLYKNILVPNGIINLKTDSEFLHGYMLGLIKSTKFLELIYSNHNIYNNSGAPDDVLSIQTFYELKFLKQKKPITFINFKVLK